MDDISIDVIKEIGEYDNVFSEILRVKGAERIHAEIIAFVQDAGEKNLETIRGWQRISSDIVQSKEKIARQNEQIRVCISAYGVSYEEYDEIIADTDIQKQHLHLKRFLEERMGEIQGTLLAQKSLDRQIHSLNEPNEMLEMRKNLYIDRKNIAEALSVILFNDAYTKRMIRSLWDEKTATLDTYSRSEVDSPIEVIFEESFKKMARVLSLVEQYQQSGLQGIRRLEEFDRQIVYMLTALALKKHK